MEGHLLTRTNSSFIRIFMYTVHATCYIYNFTIIPIIKYPSGAPDPTPVL